MVRIYIDLYRLLSLVHLPYFNVLQVAPESGMYDYVRSPGDEMDEIQSSIQCAHYEFSDEELYWQPANREDDLKEQLQKLGVIQVSEESLKYVLADHLDGYISHALCPD